ncbi:MAG: hypothetical protein AAB778_01135 [Patescibacteria group bacterium]
MLGTRDQIKEYIKKRDHARVEDIRREFKLGTSIIHRHLIKLIKEGDINKLGKPPLVFYTYDPTTKKVNSDLISTEDNDFLLKNYLYISPVGDIKYGIEGFQDWVTRIKQEKYLIPLVSEYIKYRKNTNKFRNNDGLLNGFKKLKATFNKVYLDKVFFSDFYALPKFGKTMLGQKLLYAKQTQSEFLTEEVSKQVLIDVNKVIRRYKIDAVAFIPPTVPRRIQFIKELEKSINLNLPKLLLTKAYPSGVLIAQKTLSKLEERIENAKKSILVKDQNINYGKILVIDDAIGSGSTLNEVAAKIKKVSPKTKVYGYSIVGSFKGFDVISEV